jgi:hypothetical protein
MKFILGGARTGLNTYTTSQACRNALVPLCAVLPMIAMIALDPGMI